MKTKIDKPKFQPSLELTNVIANHTIHILNTLQKCIRNDITGFGGHGFDSTASPTVRALLEDFAITLISKAKKEE